MKKPLKFLVLLVLIFLLGKAQLAQADVSAPIKFTFLGQKPADVYLTQGSIAKCFVKEVRYNTISWECYLVKLVEVTPTATATRRATPTYILPTITLGPPPTLRPTNTSTARPTDTPTATPVPTSTFTATATNTATNTSTATYTATPTATNTATSTPTRIPTNTPTETVDPYPIPPTIDPYPYPIP